MQPLSTAKIDNGGPVWPPNYVQVYASRQNRILKLVDNIAGAKEYYRTRPVDFINDWVVTYDPRHAGTDIPPRLPLILFRRQEELVGFLMSCLEDQESGLVEKCRDMGATWVCAAFSVWLWLFWPGSSVGWGSRKETLIDKIGDPDSIFEKMRIIVMGLPRPFWPADLSIKEHMTYMRFVNPETDSTITGEAGDNIGRGGRKLIYFKDEAQPLDALILTPVGWTRMGDIIPGDMIIGADGNAHAVTHINDAGVHDVYRLTFSDGTTAQCSENHLWRVEKKWGKRETIVLRASEIAKRFLYHSPGGQTQYIFRVQMCKPVMFDTIRRALPLHPYVLGAMLGDGSVSQVPAHCPKFTNMDRDVVERVANNLPKGCVLRKDSGRDYEYRLVDEAGMQGNLIKSRARQAIVDSGIAGKSAHDKNIPHQYKMLPPSDRLEVLRGLMDTDGSASGGVASFHTCSVRLADDVIFIVQSLGGTATHNVKSDRRGYRDMHVLHLAMPDGMCPFNSARKKAALSKRKHPAMRTIVDVEKITATVVRCLTIDSDDGLYLTDEFIVTHNSAHYERPERIEASLADNTRVQIDISSVHGLGNVFHRRREAGALWTPGAEMPKGKTRIMVLDWRDHPAKTQEWYDARRAKAVDEGMLHIFAQEVERNYSASVQGVIIQDEWVKASIDAHLKLTHVVDGEEVLSVEPGGPWGAALDVADGGGDRNALVKREGIVLRSAEEWGEIDTAHTARRAVKGCEGALPVNLQYDCIGVGSGVKAETNRLSLDGTMPAGLRFVPWNAGAAVNNPDGHVIPGDKDSPINKDHYANLKAQGWWELRNRFYRTYMAITEDAKYPVDTLISLPCELPLLRQIEKELCQATSGTGSSMKIVVNKMPEGTKSPNIADAIVMAYWPAQQAKVHISGSRPFRI